MPKQSNVFVSRQLSGVAASSGKNDYACEMILPPITATTQSGIIFTIDGDEDQRREYDDAMAPGSEHPVVDLDVDQSKTYFCRKYGYKRSLPDEVAAAAEPEVKAQITDLAADIGERIKLKREIRLVAAIAAAATAASMEATVVEKWDDYNNADSNPIQYLESKITAIEDAHAISPNCLFVPGKVLRKISMHPEFQLRGRDTLPPSQMTSGLQVIANNLATMLGIDNVYFNRVAKKNTAKKGATKSFADIWGNNCLLYYKDPNPRRSGTANYGLTINWNHAEGGGGVVEGYRVRRWRDEDRESEVVAGSAFYELKIVNPNSGYWIKSVLT